jgi:outer membrane protein
MRGIAFGLFIASALASTAASAQFENHSVSLSAGYLAFEAASEIRHGLPVGLGYSGYIDNGFEWTASLEVMLLTTRVTEQNVFGLSGGPGIRYLFLQESVRPWVGSELKYVHLFGSDQVSSYVGLNPEIGLDVFVTEQFSLGGKGQFNLYARVQERVEVQMAFGGSVVGTAWF